jgi:hypothetical protein
LDHLRRHCTGLVAPLTPFGKFIDGPALDALELSAGRWPCQIILLSLFDYRTTVIFGFHALAEVARCS